MRWKALFRIGHLWCLPCRSQRGPAQARGLMARILTSFLTSLPFLPSVDLDTMAPVSHPARANIWVSAGLPQVPLGVQTHSSRVLPFYWAFCLGRAKLKAKSATGRFWASKRLLTALGVKFLGPYEWGEVTR